MRSFAALRMTEVFGLLTIFLLSSSSSILLRHDRRMNLAGCWIGRRRCGAGGDRRQERSDRGGGGLGVFFHRGVAEALEDLELGALDVSLEAEGVGDGHPAVLCAPQDQCRH